MERVFKQLKLMYLTVGFYTPACSSFQPKQALKANDIAVIEVGLHRLPRRCRRQKLTHQVRGGISRSRSLPALPHLPVAAAESQAAPTCHVEEAVVGHHGGRGDARLQRRQLLPRVGLRVVPAGPGQRRAGVSCTSPAASSS